MRIMIAGLAASVALAFALPAQAQQEGPQPGTSAYCKTLKTTKAKNECLKRVQAQAKTAPKAQAKAKTKSKPTKTTPAPKPDNTATATPPPFAAQAPAPTSPTPTSTVAVPPLPQRTI
jgi:hypothetical protein